MSAETCPRCGLPIGNYSLESCAFPLRPWSSTDETKCRFVALGYRRGIDEGVRLAKATAKVAEIRDAWTPPNGPTWIDWTDVDAAAAKAKGGE